MASSNEDKPVESKRRHFPNPGKGKEVNSLIVYPLDDEDRVEIGGAQIERMLRAMEKEKRRSEDGICRNRK